MTSGASTGASATPPSPFGDGDVLLADTSVWRRAHQFAPELATQWDRALANDRIATSPVIVFELLYHLRLDRPAFDLWRERLAEIRRNLIPDASVWALAREAYIELAHASQLSGKSMTDILVAATATRTNIPVLHVNRDYPRLRELNCLDFEARRLVPEGTAI